jgi:hypothetical protein
MTPLMDYQFPEPYGVVKVFVGGCIERGDGSSFRAKAHAHCNKTHDKNYGTICVRSYKRLYTPSGKPSHLMWHELAHIITGQGHTANFVKCMTKKLGLKLDKSERYACRRALEAAK